MPTETDCIPGPDAFLNAIKDVDHVEAERLEKIAEWAIDLESKGLCTLCSKKQKNPSIHVRTRHQGENLAIGFAWKRKPHLPRKVHITLWRPAFTDLAHDTLPRVEKLTGWERTKRHKDVKDISDDLLRLLTEAYEEAAGQA